VDEGTAITPRSSAPLAAPAARVDPTIMELKHTRTGRAQAPRDGIVLA
jgi:hypothetical protein